MKTIQTNPEQWRCAVMPSSASERRRGVLLLEDGTAFAGTSFGCEIPSAGEVVFSTGMVGYPESLTDPSYRGQILTLTYPLVGNYGVPDPSCWESGRIHACGLVVSSYVDTPSHAQSTMPLAAWLRGEGIPALAITDTRLLTQHLRTHGTLLGKIVFDEDTPFSFYNPDPDNLVAEVSAPRVSVHGGDSDVTMVLVDCGTKRTIECCLLSRGVRVITVPWDYPLFAPGSAIACDGIVVSNGPGNPTTVGRTIQTLRTALDLRIPVFGICLGHQLLALAAGGDTYKLKFGHRSQNQPCVLYDTKRCYITTQNHGFAVGTLPPDFIPWFINANDGSNEGMRHRELPFLSVQFHPEATPGPTDTEWIFDHFIEKVRAHREAA